MFQVFDRVIYNWGYETQTMHGEVGTVTSVETLTEPRDDGSTQKFTVAWDICPEVESVFYSEDFECDNVVAYTPDFYN